MSATDPLDPLDLDTSGAVADGAVGETAVAEGAVAEGKGFSVHLVNFEGPFDLLLQLISKHKLDITEIALSVITDDFIAHIKALGSEWDLDQTSEFLLIAATLLDLKAARLLPKGEVEDDEDLALLEARDLLFARLLQYRAFKQIAALVQDRMAAEAKRFPRAVGVEPRFAELLPEVLLGIDPAGLAALAARALAPKNDVPPGVSLEHLHAPAVTVREQALVIVDRLRRQRSATFRSLVADSPDTVTTVCRFLALLELFREAAVSFDQVTPLGELTIRWTGADDGEIDVSDEFDEEAKPADESGEAPLVEDDPHFLEPGETLTDESDIEPPAPPTNASDVERSASLTNASDVEHSASPTDASDVERSASLTNASDVAHPASPTDASDVERSASPTNASDVEHPASLTDASDIDPGPALTPAPDETANQ